MRMKMNSATASCPSSSCCSTSSSFFPPRFTSVPRTTKFPLYSFGWFETRPLLAKQSSLNKKLSPLGALVTSNSLDVSTASLIGDEKIGVLLLNLGGPETLEDVQHFLFNLFADPDIIRLPRLFRFLQKPLAQFISVVRAPKSKEGYASIGGDSSLQRITDAQAEELRKSLWEKKCASKGVCWYASLASIY